MNLSQFKKRAFAQHKTGPGIGALLNVYSSTAVIYTPLTFAGVVTTVYGLWGGQLLRSWFPWFNTTHLFISMIVFILVAMVFFFKYILPSMYAFQVQQQYKHKNPLVEDIQKVLEGQAELKQMLTKLNQQLEDRAKKEKYKK